MVTQTPCQLKYLHSKTQSKSGGLKLAESGGTKTKLKRYIHTKTCNICRKFYC
jgi:hypothetical protein